MEKEQRIRVHFRMIDGEVLAVFPDLPAKFGNHVCYAHVGQHSEADSFYCRTAGRPAKPEEYADLAKELTKTVGYQPLHIVGRIIRPKAWK